MTGVRSSPSPRPSDASSPSHPSFSQSPSPLLPPPSSPSSLVHPPCSSFSVFSVSAPSSPSPLSSPPTSSPLSQSPHSASSSSATVSRASGASFASPSACQSSRSSRCRSAHCAFLPPSSASAASSPSARAPRSLLSPLSGAGAAGGGEGPPARRTCARLSMASFGLSAVEARGRRHSSAQAALCPEGGSLATQKNRRKNGKNHRHLCRFAASPRTLSLPRRSACTRLRSSPIVSSAVALRLPPAAASSLMAAQRSAPSPEVGTERCTSSSFSFPPASPSPSPSLSPSLSLSRSRPCLSPSSASSPCSEFDSTSVSPLRRSPAFPPQVRVLWLARRKRRAFIPTSRTRGGLFLLSLFSFCVSAGVVSAVELGVYVHPARCAHSADFASSPAPPSIECDLFASGIRSFCGACSGPRCGAAPRATCLSHSLQTSSVPLSFISDSSARPPRASSEALRPELLSRRLASLHCLLPRRDASARGGVSCQLRLGFLCLAARPREASAVATGCASGATSVPRRNSRFQREGVLGGERLTLRPKAISLPLCSDGLSRCHASPVSAGASPPSASAPSASHANGSSRELNDADAAVEAASLRVFASLFGLQRPRDALETPEAPHRPQASQASRGFCAQRRQLSEKAPAAVHELGGVRSPTLRATSTSSAGAEEASVSGVLAAAAPAPPSFFDVSPFSASSGESPEEYLLRGRLAAPAPVLENASAVVARNATTPFAALSPFRVTTEQRARMEPQVLETLTPWKRIVTDKFVKTATDTFIPKTRDFSMHKIAQEAAAQSASVATDLPLVRDAVARAVLAAERQQAQLREKEKIGKEPEQGEEGEDRRDLEGDEENRRPGETPEAAAERRRRHIARETERHMKNLLGGGTQVDFEDSFHFHESWLAEGYEDISAEPRFVSPEWDDVPRPCKNSTSITTLTASHLSRPLIDTADPRKRNTLKIQYVSPKEKKRQAFWESLLVLGRENTHSRLAAAHAWLADRHEQQQEEAYRNRRQIMELAVLRERRRREKQKRIEEAGGVYTPPRPPPYPLPLHYLYVNHRLYNSFKLLNAIGWDACLDLPTPHSRLEAFRHEHNLRSFYLLPVDDRVSLAAGIRRARTAAPQRRQAAQGTAAGNGAAPRGPAEKTPAAAPAYEVVFPPLDSPYLSGARAADPAPPPPSPPVPAASSAPYAASAASAPPLVVPSRLGDFLLSEMDAVLVLRDGVIDSKLSRNLDQFGGVEGAEEEVEGASLLERGTRRSPPSDDPVHPDADATDADAVAGELPEDGDATADAAGRSASRDGGRAGGCCGGAGGRSGAPAPGNAEREEGEKPALPAHRTKREAAEARRITRRLRSTTSA
ncbi:sufB/sufD domain-containing protein [Besnoitia besnoiti]|uniref:SufB/sufD domain-containing protein n=1 Tax=Besnoitia besnoiti TaxID=94643 RepID=A0A2A9MM07_BESBE|nr:sufB/sufD domain-containing protein [Besnoitia besnoiti]PFH37401.1 sufB/sufD domain-containing protein [Besnoitia besnoiti]